MVERCVLSVEGEEKIDGNVRYSGKSQASAVLVEYIDSAVTLGWCTERKSNRLTVAALYPSEVLELRWERGCSSVQRREN
jgi:hypothetical protein